MRHLRHLLHALRKTILGLFRPQKPLARPLALGRDISKIDRVRVIALTTSYPPSIQTEFDGSLTPETMRRLLLSLDHTNVH